jgi:hypothetical protein
MEEFDFDVTRDLNKAWTIPYSDETKLAKIKLVAQRLSEIYSHFLTSDFHSQGESYKERGMWIGTCTILPTESEVSLFRKRLEAEIIKDLTKEEAHNQYCVLSTDYHSEGTLKFTFSKSIKTIREELGNDFFPFKIYSRVQTDERDTKNKYLSITIRFKGPAF